MNSAPAGAAFPGANGRIACSGALATELGSPPPQGQSALEIFTINPDASGQTRLQNNTNSDFNPRFSADGTKIAFVKDDQVWTMNSDGTNERGPLTGSSAISPAPKSTGTNNFVGGWSPDGTQIVFASSRDGNTEIYKMSADGSNQVNLTNNATAGANRDNQPAWSPDGTKIAFQSNRAGNTNIHVMQPDGSNVINLTGDSTAEESAPEYSPDGQQIAFHTDRVSFPRPARNLEIYRMNADGTGAKRLTFSDFSGGGGTASPNFDLTGYDLFPHWSPEGDRIVFHSGRAPEFRNSGQAGIIAQWEAYTIDAVNGEGPGGSIPTRLTNRAGNDERCGWQPTRRAAPQPPAAGGYPLPYPLPGGGGGASIPPKATVCPNSAGVRVIGRTNSGGRVFQGTNGNDRICGTSAGDLITGNGGNDVISGGGGNDRINGGSGSDRINGGSGKDLISGGSGNDSIVGASGNDRVNGNSGKDRISGGSGNDRLNGSSGNDVVSGGSGRDVISGGSGNDRLSGNSGNDRINGNSGNDRIFGGSGNDRLKGGSGDDRLVGGPGKDRISGGSGRNQITQ